MSSGFKILERGERGPEEEISEKGFTYEKAKEQLERLEEKVRNEIIIKTDKDVVVKYCPFCEFQLYGEYGCADKVAREGSFIVGGIQCNHPKTAGFHEQVRREIPKALRRYLE